MIQMMQMILKLLPVVCLLCLADGKPHRLSNEGNAADVAENAEDQALYDKYMASDNHLRMYEAAAAEIAEADDDDKTNPEENPGKKYFEGDIILPKTQMSRNAIHNRFNWKWPQNTIPYAFENDYPTNMRQAVTIVVTFLQYQINELGYCFTIRPKRASDNYYVLIGKRDKSCSSLVGWWGDAVNQGDYQYINLYIGCFRPGIAYGTPVHEFMHAMGFWHEQSRTDRDKYIKVHKENVIPEAWDNFEVEHDSNNQGFPYDYGSVMHYPRTAFAKREGLITIETYGGQAIGQRIGPSYQDIQEIRKLYNCN